MRLLLLLLYTLSAISCTSITEDQRVECLPGTDKNSCTALGCIWEPTESTAPNCYLPPQYGYSALSDLYEIENGMAIDLEKSTSISMFDGDFEKVTVSFVHMSENLLRIKMEPVDEKRYQVPITILGSEEPPTTMNYEYQITKDPVFSFKVVRKLTGTVLFDTSLGGLTLADQFLQLAVQLSSSNVYGFGEQEQPSLRHDMNWKTWGMFARDHAPEGDANLYGVHPYYMNVEPDGNTHGVLFLNSNAQEVTMTPAPGLVYRTIGGILDIYIYLGPTPEKVVGQYTASLGRYEPPPFWALGFHLCRWGYNSVVNMKAAWQRTLDSGIPFDVQWGDIDYMDRALDFTYNPTDFQELPAFVDELHEKGMKFVPILDPCISTGEPAGSYPPFDEGNTQDIWVKDASGNPLMAKVWPADYCHFPDFFTSKTEDWWLNQLANFYSTIKYDGIWIDMNEPANFVTGSVDGCQENKWNNPPYKPKTDGGDSLLDKTICMDATQSEGIHYDVHSMFGWSEARATNRALREITGKRPFIISRSTFVGSGKYTGHWLGDNWSEWDNMHFSIIGMLQFNHFGMPLVGADICGFIGNTTEELCARWHQLGAFYPFSRNHNLLESVDQDPGFWGLDSIVARAARNALKTKYALLPYLYSLFYKSYNEGGTVARPLWHEFVTDQEALGIDTQFLLGPAVMVSPILDQGKTKRNVYLPGGENTVWYDAYTFERFSAAMKILEVTSDLNNPEDSTPLHIRGGYILPVQDPAGNTAQQRETRTLNLFGYLDSEEKGTGEVYLDDGESMDLTLYTHVKFMVNPGKMDFEVVQDAYTDAMNWKIDYIRLAGISQNIDKVEINGEAAIFTYNPEYQILDILPENFMITGANSITWTSSASHQQSP